MTCTNPEHLNFEQYLCKNLESVTFKK